jgi:tetratricopeptide (TPR) repeat protein
MWVSDSYEDIEQQARAHMNNGDFTEALDGYQRLARRLEALKPVILERRPELSQLHILCLVQQARILHWRGSLREARETYQILIEKDPSNQGIWREGLALVLIDMGEVEAGLDELRAQGVASPGDAAVWLTIAQECDALGRHEEAEENYQRAVKNAASPDIKNQVYLALFDFYRGKGQVDKALEAWNKAWEDRDSQPDYIFPIYQMMWENGDSDRADEYLQREVNPLRKGFYHGWFAFERDDMETAVKHWQKVVKMKPWQYDEGHDAWAEAALRVEHSSKEVVSVLEAVQNIGAMTLRGLILLAAAEARQGHIEEARAALTTARNVGLRSRPREEFLSLSNWQLLDELVPDEAAKKDLRQLFTVENS